MSSSGTRTTVTRSEFESHQAHVDQRFNALTASMADGFGVLNSQITSISNKLDRATAPNYSLIVSVVAIILPMISFGGAVVWMMSNHNEQMSVARYDNIKTRLDQFISGGNRWTETDHKEFAAAVEADFQSTREAIGALRISETQNVAQLAALRENVDSVETHLHEHEKQANHPFGVMQMIEQLRARVAILEGRGGTPNLEN